jgi:hypothetical protein
MTSSTLVFPAPIEAGLTDTAIRPGNWTQLELGSGGAGGAGDAGGGEGGGRVRGGGGGGG